MCFNKLAALVFDELKITLLAVAGHFNVPCIDNLNCSKSQPDVVG